jgi:hypothetical protein
LPGLSNVTVRTGGSSLTWIMLSPSVKNLDHG